MRERYTLKLGNRLERRESRETEAKRLRQDVEWALESSLAPTDVLPLLHRLARTAKSGSDESAFAHRQLAELLVEREPWRATLHARKVLTTAPDDERAWAALALSQTLLGNYRYAANAYGRALRAAPKNPWYAHNLGHLLDVALDKPKDAVDLLRSAFEGSKRRAAPNSEIAASFVHALARAGEIDEAKRVLTHTMKRGGSRELAALMKWLEAGAPEKEPHHAGAHAAAPEIRAVASTRRKSTRPPPAAADASENASRAIPAELDAALLRGLMHLPLTIRQRARARMLAREPFARTLGAELTAQGDLRGVQALAAALTYVIIYTDEVPLTQSEVAASFRVSGASLRLRFTALRSELQLPRRVLRAPRRHV
jgi:Flp pilus assembly protein TadD